MTTHTSSDSLLVPGARLAADGRTPIATLLGADFSALSITPSRADQAPPVVRTALARFAPWDAAHRVSLEDRCVLDMGDLGASRLAWAQAFDAIVAGARAAYDAGHFTIALGGDHSVTWPLVTAFAAEGRRVGVVQLDVHHDVRPLDRGPSNGTPIRGLIERGVVRADDVVQLGIHPFANRRELTAWCDEQRIARVPLDELVSRGPDMIAADARRYLRQCDAIYLTVDIDVLDRAYAPGTVAAMPGGLVPRQLVALVERLCADPRLIAMDVVEFDPSRDVGGVTAHNVAYVVMTALSAVARREVQPR